MSRPVSIGLAVCFAVWVVAFGTGYSTSVAQVVPGGAWMAKGTSITHVNGPAQRTDAELAKELAAGPEDLQVYRPQTELLGW